MNVDDEIARSKKVVYDTIDALLERKVPEIDQLSDAARARINRLYHFLRRSIAQQRRRALERGKAPITRKPKK